MAHRHIFLVNSRPDDAEFVDPFVDEAKKGGVLVTLLDPRDLSFVCNENATVELFEAGSKIEFTEGDFVYIRRTKNAATLGALLGWFLDSVQVPFNDKDAYLRNAVANSKLSQSFRLREIVPSPTTWVTSKAGFLANRQRITDQLGYPLVAKTDGANGTCVWKIEDETELDRKIDELTITGLSNEPTVFILQKFVPNTFDMRVVVFKGEVLSAIARHAGNGQFHNNISQGGKAEKIELTEEEKNIAVAVASKLGLELAGVDLVRTPDGVRLFEVNKSPGLINDVVGDSNVRKIIARLFRK